jgi:hypothetical protein
VILQRLSSDEQLTPHDEHHVPPGVGHRVELDEIRLRAPLLKLADQVVADSGVALPAVDVAYLLVDPVKVC